MGDWKNDLDDFFKSKGEQHKAEDAQKKQNTLEAEQFIAREVIPAFEELKVQLEKHGRQVNVSKGTDSASITVSYNGSHELELTVITRGTGTYPKLRFRDRTDGKMYRSEGMFGYSSTESNIFKIKKEDIIKHFIEEYKHFATK